jgi:hypothetical protein
MSWFYILHNAITNFGCNKKKTLNSIACSVTGQDSVFSLFVIQVLLTVTNKQSISQFIKNNESILVILLK